MHIHIHENSIYGQRRVISASPGPNGSNKLSKLRFEGELFIAVSQSLCTAMQNMTRQVHAARREGLQSSPKFKGHVVFDMEGAKAACGIAIVTESLMLPTREEVDNMSEDNLIENKGRWGRYLIAHGRVSGLCITKRKSTRVNHRVNYWGKEIG